MSNFFGGGGGGGGLTGGMSNAAKLAAGALLVHQLMKHARGDAASGGGGMTGGGMGGMLGGLLGGSTAGAGSMGTGAAGGGMSGGGLGGLLGGAGLGALLSGGGLGSLIGGLGGMLGNLRGQGLGSQVDSWVSPGPNQQVSAQDLERGFDPGELDEAARQAGTDRGSVLQEMSGLLPQLVDRATPQGSMPSREEDVGHGGLGGLLSGLLGGPAPMPPGPRA